MLPTSVRFPLNNTSADQLFAGTTLLRVYFETSNQSQTSSSFFGEFSVQGKFQKVIFKNKQLFLNVVKYDFIGMILFYSLILFHNYNEIVWMFSCALPTKPNQKNINLFCKACGGDIQANDTQVTLSPYGKPGAVLVKHTFVCNWRITAAPSKSVLVTIPGFDNNTTQGIGVGGTFKLHFQK